MALDVYVGSLTRYYADEWENVSERTARERGTQFRIGPYTVAISADNSLQNVGCDLIQADTGQRVALPQWFLPSAVSLGGYREEWALYTHPKRLAFHNEETGLVRVIEMPPIDRTGWRVLTALALFSAPGFWCWRNRVK